MMGRRMGGTDSVEGIHAYTQFCRDDRFTAQYNVCTYRELRGTAVCA